MAPRKRTLPPGALLTRTKLLLIERSVPYQQIASDLKDTGITYEWLTKLASGAICDPSVNRTEALFNYLSKDTVVEDILASN